MPSLTMLSLLSLMLLATGVRADFQCTLIPGNLRQIDAGAGKVYGINAKEEVFQWVDHQWKQIPGQLSHVSVGPAGVWGVNKANNIYMRQNSSWMPVAGALKQVDAGGNKFVAGVNANDNIYCLRQSCTLAYSSAATFTLLDGGLKYYSCGPIGCWGVNNGNYIYYRHNVKPSNCQGSHWQHIDSSLTMVEVGMDGSVFGVNSGGDVYKREGITESTPTGTSWSLQDFCGSFKHVSYDAGSLWLLNTDGDIYKCSDGRNDNHNNNM
ncbi:fish-egg lectin-like [Hyperolius riggenbachi]|uniref:fish-egg lectin-like n=1 Tax=Hyperolius riggenbachi TaxID=752182 RepID=UPI0035A27D2B